MNELNLDLPSGIRLRCRLSGPQDGPVLVFLHGFPQAAFIWDAVQAPLAALGYRCIAPNLRGYPGSSAPTEAAAYKASAVAQDVLDLMQWASPQQPIAALIAHDWGGAIAWNIAAGVGSARMQRLIAINSPHPARFLHALQNDAQQQQASSYMHFLSRADAPALLAQDNFARLWRFLRDADSPQQDPAWLTQALRQDHLAAWSAGLRGPCAYYSQSPLKPPRGSDDAVLSLQLPERITQVRVPTDLIWGQRDRALLAVVLQGLDRCVERLFIHRIADASHWVIHEQPETVVQLIRAALQRS